MFLMYIISALIAGGVLGVATVLFWQQIVDISERITKRWFFRHKAIHPYRIPNKEGTDDKFN